MSEDEVKQLKITNLQLRQQVIDLSFALMRREYADIELELAKLKAAPEPELEPQP